MHPVTRTLRNSSLTAVATVALLATSASAALAGGTDAEVDVAFACTSIEVESTKDISNVVLEFLDGDRQRFEDLPESTTGTFAGTGDDSGEVVTTAWVKSGDNTSDDGPGYGQRFDSDASCDSSVGSGSTNDEGSDDSSSTDDSGSTSDTGATGDDQDDTTDIGDDTSTDDGQGTDDATAPSDDTTVADSDDEDAGPTNAAADDTTEDTDTSDSDHTDTSDSGDRVASTSTTGDAEDEDEDATLTAGDDTAPSDDASVLSEGEERTVEAAAGTDVRSADTLPNTGLDALASLLAALSALGLGAGLLRRSRTA